MRVTPGFRRSRVLQTEFWRADRRVGEGQHSGEKRTCQEMLPRSTILTKSSSNMRLKPRDETAPGLEFLRYFSRDGVDPFDEVEWELRSAVIATEKGETVFEQRDVEIPKDWSQLATNIVVSKYFRGQIGTPDRERSVKQLIGRVVDTITSWAHTNKYFANEDDLQAFSDDLKYLLVHQKAAFNSPVWFNCGFEPAPQCSACFINSVDDTMESILTLARTEGMLFKFGSGTGSNLSTIRSSRGDTRWRWNRVWSSFVHEGLRRIRGRH